MASRLSKAEDAAELQAVFEEALAPQQIPNLASKRSANTVESVTSRLRKRLSRDLNITKRGSRSSIGTSEEELERRKELRLLRQRRIQEELSKESIYDEDAKSISTVVSTHEALESQPTRVRELTAESDVLRYSRSLNDIPQMIDRFPKLVKHATDSRGISRATTLQVMVSTKPKDTLHPRVDISNTRVRKIKSAVDVFGELPDFRHVQLRRTSSLPSIPASPKLQPQRLPSIPDNILRRESWRLSSPRPPETQSRRIFDMTFPYLIEKNASLEAITTTSARWFRSQGLRSSSQASSIESPSDPIQHHPKHVEACRSTGDLGGVDGSGESYPSIHLQDMHISRQLSSRGIKARFPIRRTLDWKRRLYAGGRPLAKQDTRSSHSFSTSSMRRSSDSIHVARLPLGRADHHESDRCSSFYDGTSLQATPDSSYVHLGLARDSGINYGAANNAANTYLPVKSSPHAVSTNSSSISSILPPSSENISRRVTIDSSILASETSSFRRQETEILSIETRFPNTKVCQPPLNSRFVEIFDRDSEELQDTCLEVSALNFQNHSRELNRSFDGHVSISVPPASGGVFAYSFSSQNFQNPRIAVTPDATIPSERRKTGNLSPTDLPPDSAMELWSKALKANQEERSQQMRDLLALPDKARSRRKRSSIKTRYMRIPSQKLKGMDEVGDEAEVQFEGNSEAAEDHEATLRRRRFEAEERMAKAHEEVRAWTRELHRQEQEARAKSAIKLFKEHAVKRSRSIPESWSRFPSHTRDERNGLAGAQDKVASSDFAVRKAADPSADRIETLGLERESSFTNRFHSLPASLSKRLRQSMYRLRASRSARLGNTVHHRKSSIDVGGELAYPELEVLPLDNGGRSDLAELQDEIASAFRRQERMKRMMAFNDGSADLPPSTDNMAVIKINDPAYYQDCVWMLAERSGHDSDAKDTGEDVGSLNSESVMSVPEKNDAPLVGDERASKYHTWNGRDRGTRAGAVRGRNHSAHDLDRLWRNSTADYVAEVAGLEERERVRAIRSAETLFGEAPLHAAEDIMMRDV